MAWLEFNDYAVQAANIRGEQMRQDIVDELLDHMEAKAEWLVSCGSSHEDAVEQVLAGMGEAGIIREQMEQVHRRLPEDIFSGALGLIDGGLFLQFFTVDIWHLQLISTSIGAILMLAGLYRLRGSNDKLRRAWIAGLVWLGWVGCVGIALALPLLAGINEQWLGLVTAALMVACLHLLGSGLAELCRGCAVADEKAPQIHKLGGDYALAIILTLLVGSVGSVFILVPIIFYIIVLVQIGKARSFLLRHGVSTGARELDRGGRWQSAGVLVLLIVLPLVISAVVALQTPAASAWPEQISAEAEAARQHLLELKLEPDIAADLPEDELLLLADAERLAICTYYQESSLVMRLIVFQLPEGRKRILVEADWDELPARAYRDGLTLSDPQQRWDDDPQLNCWSVSEADGKRQYQPFISQQDDRLGLLGGEFRLLPQAANQQRAYIAATYVDWEDNSFSHQRSSVNQVIAYYTHRTQLLMVPFASSAVKAGFSYGTKGMDGYEAEFFFWEAAED